VTTDGIEFWIERDEYTVRIMSSNMGQEQLTEFVIFSDGTWVKSVNGNIQEKSL